MASELHTELAIEFDATHPITALKNSFVQPFEEGAVHIIMMTSAGMQDCAVGAAAARRGVDD